MDWGPALAPCRWTGWARRKEACPYPHPLKAWAVLTKSRAWEAGLAVSAVSDLLCRKILWAVGKAHGRERDWRCGQEMRPGERWARVAAAGAAL